MLWKYRGMVGNPRYGRIGLIALPYFWVFELLAPVLELTGLILVPLGVLLGVVDLAYAGLFLMVTYGYALVVTLAAMAVEELSFHKYPRWRDLGALLLAAVLENLGYRQLTAWWRLEGLWAGLRGGAHVWGTMTREGFGETDRRSIGSSVAHGAPIGPDPADPRPVASEGLGLSGLPGTLPVGNAAPARKQRYEGSPSDYDARQGV